MIKFSLNRKKLYILLVVFICLISVLSLWILGIFDYLFSGMAALPGNKKENDNLSLSSISNPTDLQISIDLPEKNKNLLLFDNEQCTITVENTYVSPDENAFYIRLHCYGNYSLNHTTFYTPKVSNFQVGKIITENGHSLPVLLKADGPMKKNYYIMDLCISDYDTISSDEATLEIPEFSKHHYQRIDWL